MSSTTKYIIGSKKSGGPSQSSQDGLKEERVVISPLNNYDEVIGILEGVKEIDDGCTLILKNVHFVKIPHDSEILDFVNTRIGKKIAILNCDGKLFCRDVIN